MAPLDVERPCWLKPLLMNARQTLSLSKYVLSFENHHIFLTRAWTKEHVLITFSHNKASGHHKNLFSCLLCWNLPWVYPGTFYSFLMNILKECVVGGGIHYVVVLNLVTKACRDFPRFFPCQAIHSHYGHCAVDPLTCVF